MDYVPLSGREFPRYSALKTFFRLPYVELQQDYDLGIFGIPFDGGVSYRPGARFAPSKVRELSSLGRGYHLDRQQGVFENIKVADIGDCSTVPIDLPQTYEKIEGFVEKLLHHNKKFISVGGDHSTTLPVLRALRKKYQVPLSLIHFDAHLDTYPAAWGCEYHHGSFARHAVEEGLVDPRSMVQIGIRGPLTSSQDLQFIRKHQIRCITVDDVRASTLPEFLKTLPSFVHSPTYISYDIDCLDPAFAPGTGTPVPGGLTTYEVQKIFRALQIKNLVGADIVEYCPAYDPSEITGLAAVDAMFEILNLFVASRRN